MTIISLPVFVLAQSGSTNTTGTTGTTNNTVPVFIPNPAAKAGGTVLEVLYSLLKTVVMPIAAVVVVMMIIWAGFMYLTAQGNPAKIAAAHQRLMWSLIGAGILLGATGIATVVETTIKSLITP